MFHQQLEPIIKSNLAYFDNFKPIKVSYERNELIKLYWQYNQRFKSFKTFTVANGSVLDVGGGNGGLSFWKDYLLPTRLDMKMSIVDLEKGEFFSRYEKYAVLNLDNDELPFDNESFDFTMLSHLIEHVKDWKALLGQVKRVLKPGGVMYIETPSLHTLNLPKRDYYIAKGFPCTTINFFDDGTHIAPTDLNEVGSYGNANGFMILEQGYCRSVFLENYLLSYGHKHNDIEVSQYGLWSKLLFSSYIVLQKM
jgi:SAM-dependent methyltransferase